MADPEGNEFDLIGTDQQRGPTTGGSSHGQTAVHESDQHSQPPHHLPGHDLVAVARGKHPEGVLGLPVVCGPVGLSLYGESALGGLAPH